MKFGNCVGAWARAHHSCSAHKNPALYLESVAPLPDRAPTSPGYHYFVNSSPPSTCALYASRALCDGGGLDEKEFAISYITEIGSAVSNVIQVAERFGAWEPGTPTEPFEEGDVPIIDGPPYGIHVMVCSSDCAVQADGSWAGETCQGGQGDGGVERFDSTWHFRDGKLYAGNGQRHVIGVARARKFGRDLDDAPGDRAESAQDSETAPTGAATRGEEPPAEVE